MKTTRTQNLIAATFAYAATFTTTGSQAEAIGKLSLFDYGY